MDYFLITGGQRLKGDLTVSGSKNSALPILAATLMCEGPTTLKNVPHLADIEHMCLMLNKLGAHTERLPGGDLKIEVRDETNCHAEYELVRKMRASVCLMGPLLAKRNKAQVSLPGGCSIGDRPVNLHIVGLQALGAQSQLISGDVHLHAKKLTGAEVFLGGAFGSTVTGTANILMAAALAHGRTVIESAACEPEVEDLGNFLNACGAKITGHGTPRITIDGVPALQGCQHTVIPDRIEAGTFMIAAAITNGELHIRNCRPGHLLAAIDRLRHIGITIDRCEDGVVASSARRLEPIDVTTQPYPGFPTDLQAQLMALLCLADGNSIITEKIFPDRFLHVAELGRMGAQLRKEGPTVIVQGVKQLVGAPVMASDLRASAALVLAGIIARGQTTLHRVYHIDRGYECIEQKLNAVGANIQRLSE